MCLRNLFIVWCQVHLLRVTVLGCGVNNPQVGDCLHTYLERDFSAIEGIVFRKSISRKSDDTILLLGGPELDTQCQRLKDLVHCMEDLQSTCYWYKDFFPYRQLVTALRAAIDWTCQRQEQGPPPPFRMLLNTFHCMQSARDRAMAKGNACYQPRLPLNIWQRIIRQQNGIEICSDLNQQIDCLLTQDRALQSCAKDAIDHYRNVTDIFLGTWCLSKASYSTVPSHLFLSPLALLIINYVTAAHNHL